MGRLASRAEFEPASDAERETALYTAGGGYQRYPFFATRAEDVNGRFAKGKILIAGCGWGYLVDELVLRGWDAWGCDASQYAVDRAQTAHGNGARVLLGDVTVRADLDRVRSGAGLGRNQKFAYCVTEDLFPALTDAEVTAALAELRRAATTLFHIVTCSDIAAVRMPGLTWKTQAEWKALVGDELVANVETGIVV